MRIATVLNQGVSRVALEHSGRYYGWDSVMPTPAPASALALLGSMCEGTLAQPSFESAEPLGGTVTVLSPFLPPRNVICVGKNYADHVNEFDAFSGAESTIPAEPIVFTKSPSALCGPTDEVLVGADVATMLDYEIELAVVIGRTGYRIAEADARSHIAGYSVINDVTDRSAQARHEQWFLAKSLRAASPFGPVLVTADELGSDARLTTVVDGELRQDSSLSHLIFSIEQIIAYVSSYTELCIGDVIATGTPSGVGIGFTPPRCIEDGSTVTCTIEGIGAIENRFRFVAPPSADRVGAAVVGSTH